MWQLIAKAVLGGLGGGMQKYADSIKTHTADNKSESNDSNNDNSTYEGIGQSIGQLGKGISNLSKKKEEDNSND